MTLWLETVCVLLTAVAPAVDTRFVQVAPAPRAGNALTRSAGQARAVVLIEGLHLHLIAQHATRTDLRPWQQPGSVLVRTLARTADVFAFTYGQTAAVTDIADMPHLTESVRQLRQAGYAEVVLVGFSAGGLLARQFVEDHPGAGVDRVVQVCTPNAGSSLARLRVGVGGVQKPFLQSLTSQSRLRVLEERRTKLIPDDVEFVCVVANGLRYGDGVVFTRSQWPDDLQAQGVPAVALGTEHWEALRTDRGAQLVARLVRESQPRWDAAQVAAMRKRLWGEKGAGR